MNKIIPACVMEEMHNQYVEEQNRQRELERLAKIERENKWRETIANSELIPFINNALVTRGYCTLTMAEWKTELRDGYLIDLDSSYNGTSILEEIPNRFVFDFLIEQYRNAGYKISGYGVYSRSYYKEEERIICAETDCDNCQL
jgi:hypothetical protein